MWKTGIGVSSVGADIDDERVRISKIIGESIGGDSGGGGQGHVGHRWEWQWQMQVTVDIDTRFDKKSDLSQSDVIFHLYVTNMILHNLIILKHRSSVVLIRQDLHVFICRCLCRTPRYWLLGNRQHIVVHLIAVRCYCFRFRFRLWRRLGFQCQLLGWYCLLWSRFPVCSFRLLYRWF